MVGFVKENIFIIYYTIQNKDKVKIHVCVVYRVAVHERKRGVSFYHSFIIDDSINNKKLTMANHVS